MSAASTLRPATADDAAMLLEWRNDPLTRAASLDAGMIAPAAHFDWFAHALTDPDRQILIAERDGAPAGMVRFDLVAPETARRGVPEGDPCHGAGSHRRRVAVSIMLAPRMRGLGLGRGILEAALAACRFDGRVLCARIRAGNTASLALFRACGFRDAPAQAASRNGLPPETLTLTKEPRP